MQPIWNNKGVVASTVGNLSNDNHDEAVNDNEKYEFGFMRSFPIIPIRSACIMCSNCPGIKLEWTKWISSETTEN